MIRYLALRARRRSRGRAGAPMPYAVCRMPSGGVGAHPAAVRQRAIAELGRRVERNDSIERAMITLSRSDAPELDLGDGPLSHGGRMSADPA